MAKGAPMLGKAKVITVRRNEKVEAKGDNCMCWTHGGEDEGPGRAHAAVLNQTGRGLRFFVMYPCIEVLSCEHSVCPRSNALYFSSIGYLEVAL